MIEIRKSEERGRGRRSWLDSFHSFSFADYQAPRNDRFGPLRVFNEDFIAGGGGFPAHPHRDMEILTYVLEGALEHRDSEGNHGVVNPFEIQYMRAGTGIRHSEYNASGTEPVHLFQIWLFPRKEGLPPAYNQQSFDRAARQGRFAPVATPDGRQGTIRIEQDASMFVARLEPGESTGHALEAGRRAYLHVASGAVEIDGQALRAGDAAKISGTETIRVQAREPSELVLLDLP